MPHVRMNISVPEDVAKELRRQDINWSRIAVRAFRAALAGESITETITRLHDRVQFLERKLRQITAVASSSESFSVITLKETTAQGTMIR